MKAKKICSKIQRKENYNMIYLTPYFLIMNHMQQNLSLSVTNKEYSTSKLYTFTLEVDFSKVFKIQEKTQVMKF